MTSTYRRTALIAVGLAAGLAGAPLAAQDMNDNARDQVGVPLAPKDAAAQRWTLESNGRNVCQVALTAEASGAGVYRVVVPGDCGGALPGQVAAWKPVTDGAALLDGSGQVLVDFNRWSNSLLVAPRRDGVDLQLRRGA